MSPIRAFALTVFALLAGCKEERTRSNFPNLEASPKALSFEACPTLDENQQPVKDVFPDEKKLLVSNSSRAAATTNFNITGEDKDAFSFSEEFVNFFLEATSSMELPVRFSPKKKGDAKAVLLIDDGYTETQPVSIALVGTGRNLPSQPSIEVSLENKDTQGQYAACFKGGTCLLYFPDTFFKQSTNLNVKIKNTGCPTLKVTGLEIVSISETEGNLAYFIEEPSVLPTEATPILLTTADGRDEMNVRVRFSPEEDASKNPQRYAYLKVFTNDPETPQFDVQFLGNAVVPSVYSQPSFCDFSLDSDTCGFPTKQENKARFEVKNGGDINITISDVVLAKGGQGRFTLSQNVVGQVIAPGESKILEITHQDAPVYVTELVTVKATANGMPAGETYISIAGGKKPCLSTDPEDQLDFKDAKSTLTTKTVTIKNGAGCGDLVIDNVLTDTSSFFSVVEPKIPAGQVIPANGSATATVQYQKPPSGGTQAGVLRIVTNDPDYGPTPYKVVRLYSESPLDELPVAVLQGCKPSTTECAESTLSVSLTALTPKEIQLDGAKSFDPPSTSMPLGSKYLFRLVTKPSNATSASLTNDGQKVTTATTKLTLDPVATGFYRITLTVFDDQNQASPIASELKIFVTQ